MYSQYIFLLSFSFVGQSVQLGIFKDVSYLPHLRKAYESMLVKGKQVVESQSENDDTPVGSHVPVNGPSRRWMEGPGGSPFAACFLDAHPLKPPSPRPGTLGLSNKKQLTIRTGCPTSPSSPTYVLRAYGLVCPTRFD